MTATNVICQPLHDCVHLGTDAAIYTMDGIVRGFGNKVFTVPHWPGAIAARGLSIALTLIGHELSCQFSTFDACVDGIGSELPDMIERHGIADACQFLIVGWSAARQRPEAYAIETTAELPPGAEEMLAEHAHAIAPAAYRLQRLPDLVQGPTPSQALVQAAGYRGLPPIASRAETMACFRKIFEMQRHDTVTDLVWVGGFAQVTTVTPHGVEQQIIHRWSEDEVGKLIETMPIDWLHFDKAPADTSGLSRVKREMMDRKARKGLRVVS